MTNRVFASAGIMILARDSPVTETTLLRSGPTRFVVLWKDADPDIPVLKEAKAEYAKRALSSALSRRVKVPLALK